MDEGLTSATPVPNTATTHAPRGLQCLPQVAPWLRPVEWAPVVAGMSLKRCFGLHLLGAIAAFVACMSLVDLESQVSGNHWSAWADFLIFWSRYPERAAVVTGITAGSIELGFLAAAFILTPWGAGDERLRCSYAHALRHTWLLSTQAVPLILLIGLLIVPISAAVRSFEDRHPYPNLTSPTPPTRPAGAAPNSQAMKDYQAVQAKYLIQSRSYGTRWRQAMRDYKRTQPFLVRNGPELIGWTCIVAGAWVLWSLLRAIGAPRELSPIIRPPTCEFCGYNLTGAAIDRECPECGIPAADSLGPDARPGTPIDLATKANRLSAWWKCGIEAIRRPRRFGQLIQVNQPSRRYRWCLAVLLLLGILAAAPTYVASLRIQFMNVDEDLYFFLGKELFTVGMPAVSVSSAVCMVGAVLVAAAIVGWVMSWRIGRNLLPAAMQMQAHLCLFMIFWIPVGCAWTVLTFFLEATDVFRGLAQTLFIDWDLLELLFWLVPVAAWLFLNGLLLWKGVSATRYANK